MDVPAEFPEPWFTKLGGTATDLEDEAAAEIGPNHQLHGLGLRAVARCERCDHTIFEVSDGTWAIVHLSWSTLRPEPAPWPSTSRYGSLAELLQVDTDDPHH